MALNHPKTLLPNIQKIRVYNIKACSSIVRKLYLSLPYRFRSSITDLRLLKDDESMDADNGLKKYGGLENYISCFPNLKYLKIQSGLYAQKEGQHIYISSLLGSADGAKLEKLIIEGGVIEVYADDILSEKSDLYSFSTVKELILDVKEINVDLLDYIAKRLKSVQSLNIKSSKVSPYESPYTPDAKAVCEKFLCYIYTLKKVSIYRKDLYAPDHKNDEEFYWTTSDTDSDQYSDEDDSNNRCNDYADRYRYDYFDDGYSS